MRKPSEKPVAVSHEEMEDEIIGKRGTPRRNAYEARIAAALIGASIKELRKRRGLTQAQLGQLLGVKKSNISILENSGTSMTLETAVRLFGALGATITFNVEAVQ